MRATSWAGRLILPAILFLPIFLYGQVQVISPLYREKIVKPGEIFTEDILIINRGKDSVEIITFLKDYKIDKGRHHFLKADSTPFSNASWITIKHPRFLLEGERQVNLKIPVTVPKNIEPKSYHCLVFIRPQIHSIKEGNAVGMQNYYQTSIQLIHTVVGGRKEAKIVKVQVAGEKKDKLILEVQNIGDIVFDILSVRIELEGIKEDKCRLYPGDINIVEFDISGLKDKEYKNIRIVMDDGDEYLRAQRISFRKGIEPEKIPLSKIRTERYGRRKSKPVSLGLQVGTGSQQKLTASLAGNINVRNLSFNFGGYHSEYATNDFNSFRVGGSWRPSRYFNFGVGTMAFIRGDEIKYSSMLRSGISLKNTKVNFGYGLEYKIFNVNLNHRLWKKFRINLNYIKSPWRNDWRANVYIPIL